MELDLKPCPFCGHDAKHFQGNKRIAGHNEYIDDVGVICTNCDVSILEDNWDEYQGQERIISTRLKWNTRA